VDPPSPGEQAEDAESLTGPQTVEVWKGVGIPTPFLFFAACSIEHMKQKSGDLVKRKDITGIIVAGGKSRRLGQDKRFLVLGGKSCLQRVLDASAQFFDDILIVADAKEPFESLGVRVVVDLVPARATLGGLYTGLHYAGGNRIFAFAADMPCLTPATIEIVLEHAEKADIVIPDLDGQLQPMHAVYSKACLPHLQRFTQDSRLKLQDLCGIPDLTVHRIPASAFRRVDPELRSFFNINTPEDLAVVRQWIEG
jgi:molybdopterin-guanine dinucleotide biosynthesis protein A